MVLLAVDPCVGPVALACQAAASTQQAASDYVLGGLGSAFIGSAAQVGQLALAALDGTTTVDLGVGWFRANVSVIAAITLPVVVGLFVVQVLTSVLRREPGGLVRAVVGVGKALLGATLALSVTQLALTAVDGICQYIAAASGRTEAEAAAQFFDFARMSDFAPGLQILVGLALVVGFVLVWGVLLFRKAALVLVAVFAPIAFMSGLTGQFYRQFALTISISTVISAFVALTLSPALAAVVLKPHGARPDAATRLIDGAFGWLFRPFNRFWGRSSERYSRGVAGVLRHRGRRAHLGCIPGRAQGLHPGAGQAVPRRLRAAARCGLARPHGGGGAPHDRDRTCDARHRWRGAVPGGVARRLHQQSERRADLLPAGRVR
jgi:hypothetical protein